MIALPLPAVALAAGALLAALVLVVRRRDDDAGRAPAGPPGPRSLATPAVLALVLGAAWAGPLATSLAFAGLSAWMLQGLLALEVPCTAPPRLPRLACYACVPLQYALVSAAPGAAPVALPLIAALALPLVTIAAGDLGALGERLAWRFQAVMLAVYALSFAAVGAAWTHGPGLVVLSAVAGSVAQDSLRAWLRRRSPVRSPRLRVLVAMAGSVLATGAAGATVAPFVAQPMAGAALVTALAALCGGSGSLVMDAMAGSRPGAPRRCGVPARLEAIAFAAPLVWALGL